MARSSPHLSFIAVLAACCALLPVRGHAAERVALVIGCGKYRAEGVPELSTPANDARRVASALRVAPMSFEVVEIIDATRNAFFEGLNTFRAKGRGAKVVMVYFSGHGIEFEGS